MTRYSKMIVGGSKLIAKRFGAKFEEIGLRTYFLMPLDDDDCFHIFMIDLSKNLVVFIFRFLE